LWPTAPALRKGCSATTSSRASTKYCPQSITKNTTLIRSIQAEHTKRVRNGTAAREAAAQHFVKAPKILDQIMSNEQSSPRHRIEAVRELRATTAGAAGAEATIDTGEKFIIQINLGGDTEIFEKVITPTKPLLAANKDEGVSDE
jgi:hypothetical protein